MFDDEKPRSERFGAIAETEEEQDLRDEVGRQLDTLKQDLAQDSDTDIRKLKQNATSELAQKVARGETDTGVQADTLREQVDIQAAIQRMASFNSGIDSPQRAQDSKKEGGITPSLPPTADDKARRNAGWSNIPSGFFKRKPKGD